jgi:hypothetical protein
MLLTVALQTNVLEPLVAIINEIKAFAPIASQSYGQHATLALTRIDGLKGGTDTHIGKVLFAVWDQPQPDPNTTPPTPAEIDELRQGSSDIAAQMQQIDDALADFDNTVSDAIIDLQDPRPVLEGARTQTFIPNIPDAPLMIFRPAVQQNILLFEVWSFLHNIDSVGSFMVY